MAGFISLRCMTERGLTIWADVYGHLTCQPDYGKLPDARKFHLLGLAMLALHYDNRVPGDPAWVRERLRAREHVDLARFVVDGFCDYTGAVAELSERVAMLPALITRDMEDEAVQLWNVMASQHGLPQIARLTTARKKSLACRLRDCGGMEGWRAAIDRVPQIPFLLGENERGWLANFDWLIQPSSFTRLMEGVYGGQRRRAEDVMDTVRAAAAEADRVDAEMINGRLRIAP